MAQKGELTAADISGMVKDIFATLDGPVEHGTKVMRGDWAQEIASYAASLQTTLDSDVVPVEVARLAHQALATAGLSQPDLTTEIWALLVEGVGRAMVEHQGRLIHQLTEPLLPYRPRDKLFQNDGTGPAGLPGPGRASSSEAGQEFGPTVTVLVDRYLSAKAGAQRRTKTVSMRRAQLGLLVEHLGAGTRTSGVSADHMRAFVEGVVRLRRRHHTGPDPSFVGRQTDDHSARLNPKTVELHIASAKSFLTWAQQNGYWDNPPISGLTIEKVKRPKGKKARRPFHEDELRALFSAPIFTGCVGRRRRNDPGKALIKDATYWLPILAYYTGARLGELVQLHLSDVSKDDGVHFIDINEENIASGGAEKHVKSEAGIRRVPIHRDLVELGFLTFVGQRRKKPAALKTNRLFYEMPYGADGQASTVFSKRFGRIMDAAGLSDPALVFHSFRHTVQDALRNAKQEAYVIHRIVGHDEGHVSGGYGEGASLSILKEAVDEMKLPVSLLDIVG